ncbi:MFS transporter [Nocardia thailandica]
MPKRNIAAIWIKGFGIGYATLMPALVALPVYVARLSPDNKETALGTLLGINALIGFLLAPFFGALSDRTTSRFGMRRPGLAVGTAGMVTGLTLMGLANSLALLYVGMAVLAVSSAATGASSYALIPDSVPQRARGLVLGVQTLIGVTAGVAASIIGPRLLGHQLILFTSGAVVLLVCMSIALLLLKDRVLDPAAKSGEPLLRAAFDGYRFDPRKAPDFSWVFASRFVLTLGISFTTAFAVYFLTDQLGVSEHELPSLISLNGVLNLGGTALGTLAGTIVADRVRSQKAIVLFVAIVLSGGTVVVAAAPSVIVFFTGSAIITFAIGLFIPTDGKLVMSVLPGGDQHVGKFMSIITIADQLPRSVGPVLGSGIIALGGRTPLGGYPLVYLVAGVAALTGGLLLRRVKGVH